MNRPNERLRLRVLAEVPDVAGITNRQRSGNYRRWEAVSREQSSVGDSTSADR